MRFKKVFMALFSFMGVLSASGYAVIEEAEGIKKVRELTEPLDKARRVLSASLPETRECMQAINDILVGKTSHITQAPATPKERKQA